MSLIKGMLDTNVVSALIRDPHEGKARSRLVAFGVDRSCISVLTSAEIQFGFAKRSSPRLERNLELLLGSITILPFGPPADFYYGRLRAHLARQGTPIGPNDLFIAAHALALDLTLVTANIGEFSRVPDLRLENWLD